MVSQRLQKNGLNGAMIINTEFVMVGNLTVRHDVGTELARDRMVACWNACIGIPTETLESMGPAESVADLQQRCEAIRGELRTELHKEAP